MSFRPSFPKIYFQFTQRKNIAGKMSFYCNIFLSQYCLQKLLVWRGAKSVYLFIAILPFKITRVMRALLMRNLRWPIFFKHSFWKDHTTLKYFPTSEDQRRRGPACTSSWEPAPRSLASSPESECARKPVDKKFFDFRLLVKLVEFTRRNIL